mgnify:CR=1 FL=1
MSAVDLARSIISSTEPRGHVAVDTARIRAELEDAQREMSRVTPHSHAWYCARDRARSCRRLLAAETNRTPGAR